MDLNDINFKKTNYSKGANAISFNSTFTLPGAEFLGKANSISKLKQLSADDLLSRLQKLVQTERKITHAVVECINEIDLRKLHLARGYSSLFDFLTLSLGYTPASAQRRIDGARLLRQIPEVAGKLESGEINLSQVSLLQKSIRQFQATTSQKVTVSYKKELLDKIANQSFKNSEVALAKELNLPLPTLAQKTQHHKDESQSVTLHFTKDEMLILDQVKNLKSNATGSLDLKSLVLHLAKRELKKYTAKKISEQTCCKTINTEVSKIEKVSNQEEASLLITSESELIGSEFEVKSELSLKTQQLSTLETSEKAILKTYGKPSLNLIQKPIPRKTYKQILKPGACCEYQDPKTHRICGSKVFLNVDHIKPRWAYSLENAFKGVTGADSSQQEIEMNSVQNLRVLCASHNKFRYKQEQFGLK
jgi:hypothetical protein